MSLEHLEALYQELPELFQNRDLVPNWHDDIIFVPFFDPENVINLDDQILATTICCAISSPAQVKMTGSDN